MRGNDWDDETKVRFGYFCKLGIVGMNRGMMLMMFVRIQGLIFPQGEIILHDPIVSVLVSR